VSALTAWLTDPRPGRGIHLAGDGEWDYYSYEELAAGARQVGAQLAAAGAGRGDVVCMLMPTGFAHLTTFFGIWAAGATPCLIVPPSFQAPADYIAHVASVLVQAEPVLVAACGGYETLIAEAMAAAGRPDGPWIYHAGTDEIEPRPAGEFGLLQFTSGSTSQPRGARASWSNLEHNIAMIHQLLGWRDGDAMASWLPLHHDMGLIGCTLDTVTAQGDLWLMQPEQFVRRPLQWLECFQPGRAAHCMTPAFAFAYLSRRVPQDRLAALDLSQWRTAVVGAETVDPAALGEFARLARPSGFSATVFRPGYGLAEATLAVSIASRPGEGTLVRPDSSSLRFGEQVRITATARLTGDPVPADEGWLAGHGRPSPAQGVGIEILGEDGGPLPEGYLGEIAVTGPSVTAGYHGGREGGATRFSGGQLRTGDAGFLHGADLFVLGRMGESLKANGSSVYVEDLDLKVSAAIGLDRSRLAVVSSYEPGRRGVVLFVEARPDGEWVEAACDALRGRLGADFPIKVIAGSRGLVRRTSSGKPRRRHMWQLLQAGELPRATVVADGAPLAR